MLMEATTQKVLGHTDTELLVQLVTQGLTDMPETIRCTIEIRKTLQPEEYGAWGQDVDLSTLPTRAFRFRLNGLLNTTSAIATFQLPAVALYTGMYRVLFTMNNQTFVESPSKLHIHGLINSPRVILICYRFSIPCLQPNSAIQCP